MTPSSSSSIPQPSIPSELTYHYFPKNGEVLPNLFEQGKIYIAATVDKKAKSLVLRRFNGVEEDVKNRIELKNLNKRTMRAIIKGNLLADATLRERANSESKIPYKETIRLIDQFNAAFNREDEKFLRQRKNIQIDRHAVLAHPAIPTAITPSGWMSAFDPESELPLLFPPQELSVKEIKPDSVEKAKEDIQNALLEANLLLASAEQSGNMEVLEQAKKLIHAFNGMLKQF